MPRYFFNLNDGRQIIPDLEGTELPDHDAARAHGCQVVRELARNRERTTRSWCLAVCDAKGELCFEVPFASICMDGPNGHMFLALRAVAEDARSGTAE